MINNPTIAELLAEEGNRIQLYNKDMSESLHKILGIETENYYRTSIKWVLVGDFLYYTMDQLEGYVSDLKWGNKNIFRGSRLSSIIDISSDKTNKHIYVFDSYSLSSDYLETYKPSQTAMLYHDFSVWLLNELILATKFHDEKEAV